MREFIWSIRAELVKMRHTFIYPLHILAAVCGSGIFLLYYKNAGTSEWAQLCALAEVIGITFPIAVSLVCSGSVKLEAENHFQVFLSGTIRRQRAFGAKYFILWLLGALTVLGTIILFSVGSCLWHGRDGILVKNCGILVLILCLGSVPLYLEHLFLNLKFSGAVSMGIGTIQFVLSALFLTGLGNRRWQFFPCTWSARGVALYSACLSGREKGILFSFEVCRPCIVCLLITAALYAIIRVWFYFYEGRQCDD